MEEIILFSAVEEKHQRCYCSDSCWPERPDLWRMALSLGVSQWVAWRINTPPVDYRGPALIITTQNGFYWELKDAQSTLIFSVRYFGGQFVLMFPSTNNNLSKQGQNKQGPTSSVGLVLLKDRLLHFRSGHKQKSTQRGPWKWNIPLVHKEIHSLSSEILAQFFSICGNDWKVHRSKGGRIMVHDEVLPILVIEIKFKKL